MKCLNCEKFDLQSNRAMAKVGFGRCPKDPAATFVSATFERSCKSFKQAPAAITGPRETWAKKL